MAISNFVTLLIIFQTLSKTQISGNSHLLQLLSYVLMWCEKIHCRSRLSFKIQLKNEYLLPYTGSRKVLENIPDQHYIMPYLIKINSQSTLSKEFCSLCCAEKLAMHIQCRP